MGRDQINRDYVDAILSYDMTPEELDKELDRLKEESDKLTEWPKM